MNPDTLYVILDGDTGSNRVGGSNNKRATRAYTTRGQAEGVRKNLQQHYPTTNLIIEEFRKVTHA